MNFSLNFPESLETLLAFLAVPCDVINTKNLLKKSYIDRMCALCYLQNIALLLLRTENPPAHSRNARNVFVLKLLVFLPGKCKYFPEYDANYSYELDIVLVFVIK